MRLILIVSGEDISVQTTHWESLANLRDFALTATHNTGRPLDDWDIRDTRGVWQHPNATVENSYLRDGDRLFVTLRVGVGGAALAA